MSYIEKEGRQDEIPIDSSMYFNYLITNNIVLPHKEYYLHWNEHLETPLVDSVKLIELDNPLMKDKHANVVGIGLLEVNEDTTRVKIFIDYGTNNNIALDERIFIYSFDEKICKWTIMDSTRWRY